MSGKPRLWLATLAVFVALPVMLAISPGVASADRGRTLPPPHVGAPRADKGDKSDPCRGHTRFNRRMFKAPTDVDNAWFSLRPGTRFVFEGVADSGDGIVPHKVVFTVTHLTKVINGVRAVVVWDQDFSDGQLVEAELAFFAQDKHGNVWTMGEYPEEYEDGTFVGAPSTWIAGQADARAGILVPGRPRAGQNFLQGFAPDVEFLDCATVQRKDAITCVDGTCFRDVLVIDESSPLDPESGHQLKLYARGKGLVKIEPLGGDAIEALSRTGVTTLGPRAAAAANQAALKLERRAYKVSEVYRHTPPARVCQSWRS